MKPRLHWVKPKPHWPKIKLRWPKIKLRWPGRRARRHILLWSAVGVVVIVTAGALTVYFQARAVYDSIHRVAVKDLGKRPPTYDTSSMNILVFGSDSRAGLDHHQQVLLHTGDVQGNNTDTIMVVHISPGRHMITVMSIPRDTMVPHYQCDSGPGFPGQRADPSAFERINALLAAGGPSCLWKTVEQQTGIHIDHFIEIGLAGFVKVIDDVGGVSVCAPFNVNDPVSGLVLPAGEHHISGVAALAFWRTREDIGNGSDLERIQRDQFMLAQVLKGILGSGLMSSPTRMFSVISGLAPSLTTDSGMSMLDLLHIGESLHGLSGKDVQFVTAPNEPFPPDPSATVQFAQPQARAMFSAIAHDVTVPRPARAPRRSGPALETNPRPAPAASGPSGRAPTATTAAKPPGTNGAPGARHSPNPSPSPSGVGSLAAGNGGITGAASCRSDASAFAGPLSP